MTTHADGQIEALTEGMRWWCSKCDATLRKPPYLDAETGERFHSARCPIPMVRVRRVLLLPAGGETNNDH